MKTIQEQIQNKCKHFTGVMSKLCNAGVDYDEVRDVYARPYKFPCFAEGNLSGGACAYRCFPTADEAKMQADEIEERGKYTMAAFAEIHKSKLSSGVIACPKCSGEMKFSRASSNGHVRAGCSCGLSFMQ